MMFSTKQNTKMLFFASERLWLEETLNTFQHQLFSPSRALWPLRTTLSPARHKRKVLGLNEGKREVRVVIETIGVIW